MQFVVIVVMIIFFTNYLIAIVSDSYAYIMENEKMAEIEGQDELNNELIALVSTMGAEAVKTPISYVIMATNLTEEENEWGGIAKTIKKKIVNTQHEALKRDEKNREEIMNIIEANKYE